VTEPQREKARLKLDKPPLKGLKKTGLLSKATF